MKTLTDQSLFEQAIGLHQRGILREAAGLYRQVVRLRPDHVAASANLGVIFCQMGDLESAVPYLLNAAQLDPSHAEVQYNLGKAFQDLGRLDEAAACYRRTLELQAGNRKAKLNLAVVLKNLGEAELAIVLCQQLLKLDAGDHSAWVVLGNAFNEMGQLESAVDCYRQALEYPNCANPHEALNNLGIALTGLGRDADAIDCYRQALEMQPDFFQAQSNLLYALNFFAEQSPRHLLAEARHFGSLVTARADPYRTWNTARAPEKRLRIGLVTGDLRNHSVGYFLEGLIASIAPDAVELFAYVTHYRDDELTERVKPFFAGWVRAIGLGDAALAKRIHDDGIDILIDLSGHTASTRLPMFAWKPAPVQVSWLGYLGTTGLSAMDYLLADPHAVPPGEEQQFAETVWRLPEIYLCFKPPASGPDAGAPPALNHAAVTFGCFNNLAKINDAVVACWCRILTATPNSRLLLKSRQLGDETARRNLLDRFAQRGVDAERLLLASWASSRDDHLGAYQQVDIALDPFPYPGITTTVESLWMGVPVLTLKGDRFIGHQGETILRNVGLPDWIALDQDDYVAKALGFAADLGALSALRARLRGQLLASPVCDAPRFARHFEAALRGMWKQWCGERQLQGAFPAMGTPDS
jgi:predicted O-linked N-acetylglucosamine transferase (SPINDLY family)